MKLADAKKTRSKINGKKRERGEGYKRKVCRGESLQVQGDGKIHSKSKKFHWILTINLTQLMGTSSKCLRQKAWHQKNTPERKWNHGAGNLFLKMLQQKMVSRTQETGKKLPARLTAQSRPGSGVIISTPRSGGGTFINHKSGLLLCNDYAFPSSMQRP